MNKRLILCDCHGSQTINEKSLQAASGLECSQIYSHLCTKQLDIAAKEIERGDALIACLQEAEIFEELAEELDVPSPQFIDIRDRAGWNDTDADATPKMAALINDFQLKPPASKLFEINSEGRCLVIGTADVALPAAAKLAEQLSVTVLLNDASEMPMNRMFDVVVGKIRNISGTLGNFSLTIDALSQLIPGGRGEFYMAEPKDGGKTQCDIVFDLSGNNPLFLAPHKRDGYLFTDPGNPLAVEKAIGEAVQLVGSFEKPFYIKNQEHLCAHSRAQITGCSKCMDVCPTGAISPLGEHISIDAAICGGCSSCVSVCPSGALTYDSPTTDFLFKRIENLARSYTNAGGKAPRLLVCDSEFGAEMISLNARFDKGLPVDTIPLEIETLTMFGHAEMLAALATGFTHVDILLAPKTERETLVSEYELAVAIAGEDKICLLDINDPSALSEALYSEREQGKPIEPILPQGSRKQITRLAASALKPNIDTPIPLPQNAPYGGVIIDKDACTLCLSCASLCPTGALADNPDMPQLRFQEDACIQCGLCTRLCPENAISLLPQLDLSENALAQKVIHEEEPFACIECGALFGVKSTIEKISEKLAGKHSMFATSEAGRLIQMCDNCRVAKQYEVEDNPLQGEKRPRIMTTEDYLKRRDH